MAFELDHRLRDSSHPVEDWELCYVGLKTDKSWPWLYLVPKREGIREICDLDAADQSQLVREIARAQQALQLLYKPDKVNTAALGNMVPQLHIHIFARYETDAAWPRPVWAIQAEEISYTDDEKNAEIQKLKECFATLKRGEHA